MDVLDVQVHPLFKAQLVAMGCDLPVAAQAGGHIQPLPLIGGILCDLTGQCRARADDAHFALQHIEELGQLVDAGLAQELAHPGDAGVVLHLEHRAVLLIALHQVLELLLCVRAHGAELVHLEQLAVASYPLLGENGAGTGAVDPDGRIGDQQQRRKRHQRQRGQKNILCPAHRPVDPILMADFGKIQRQRPMDRIDAGNVIPDRYGVGGRFYHQICFLPIFR